MNSTTATGPAQSRPLSRCAATATVSTVSTLSTGTISRIATTGRSMPPTTEDIAMWLKVNQW